MVSDDEPGADLRLRGLAVERGVGLLHALRRRSRRASGRSAPARCPAFRSATCFGPASKPTIFTWSGLPASLDAGRGALGGEQVRGEDALEVGVLGQRRTSRSTRPSPGSSLLNCWPRYVRPAALAPSSKPFARASVVEMPGWTLMTKTLPVPPISFASVVGGRLAAALVVGGDLRHGHVRLVERGVDEHDLRAAVGELLDRREHRLRVGRRDRAPRRASSPRPR